MASQNTAEHAKCSLIRTRIFFGRLACHLEWGIDDSDRNVCQTAYTDGKRVMFHSEFLASLSDSELIFVAAHEVLHVAKLHSWRMGDRNPIIWNIACDLNINLELKHDGVGSMPAICTQLCDEKYKDWCEEAIYDDLIKNAIELPQFDNVMAGEGPKDGPAATHITRAVYAAMQAGKQAGEGGGWLRGLAEIHEPQVDWRSELRRFSYPCFREGRTWARPYKRTIASGLYLPGHKYDGTPDLVCGFDTSGSITDEMLNAEVSEVNSICTEVKPSHVHALWFHGNVWRIDVLERGEPIKVPENMQSGGTSFQEVFDYFNRLKSSPCLIMFTDGYPDRFPADPGRQVIWCLNTDVTPEYGHVVRIRA